MEVVSRGELRFARFFNSGMPLLEHIPGLSGVSEWVGLIVHRLTGHFFFYF
jgi:hypothetical protein